MPQFGDKFRMPAGTFPIAIGLASHPPLCIQLVQFSDLSKQTFVQTPHVRGRSRARQQDFLHIRAAPTSRRAVLLKSLHPKLSSANATFLGARSLHEWGIGVALILHGPSWAIVVQIHARELTPHMLVDSASACTKGYPRNSRFWPMRGRTLQCPRKSGCRDRSWWDRF